MTNLMFQFGGVLFWKHALTVELASETELR